MRTYRWTWETDSLQFSCTQSSHLPPSASTSPLASISRLPVSRAWVSVARMLATQDSCPASILTHNCLSLSWACPPPLPPALPALAATFFLLFLATLSLLLRLGPLGPFSC